MSRWFGVSERVVRDMVRDVGTGGRSRAGAGEVQVRAVFAVRVGQQHLQVGPSDANRRYLSARNKLLRERADVRCVVRAPSTRAAAASSLPRRGVHLFGKKVDMRVARGALCGV